jgi:hypothetical protein
LNRVGSPFREKAGRGKDVLEDAIVNQLPVPVGIDAIAGCWSSIEAVGPDANLRHWTWRIPSGSIRTAEL